MKIFLSILAIATGINLLALLVGVVVTLVLNRIYQSRLAILLRAFPENFVEQLADQYEKIRSTKNKLAQNFLIPPARFSGKIYPVAVLREGPHLDPWIESDQLYQGLEPARQQWFKQTRIDCAIARNRYKRSMKFLNYCFACILVLSALAAMTMPWPESSRR